MDEIEQYFTTCVSSICSVVQQNWPTAKSQVNDNKDAIAILNTFVEEVSLKLKENYIEIISAIMELYPHILCHINPSVKSTDLDNQNCYAVVRTTGFKYLRERVVLMNREDQ